MAIIGNNTLLGTVAAFNLTTAKRLFGTTQEAVLPAAQRIIAVHVGWAPGNGTASGSVNACLYDQGNAAANKPVIAGSVVNIPYNAATLGASPRWISITGLSIDVSAHAGKTLCPGLAPPSQASNSGFSVLLGTVTGATRANGTTSTTNPDPFVQASSSSNQAWSIYFETETIGGGLTLDSVTPAAVTNAGQLTAIISGNAPSGTVDIIADGLTIAQTVTSWTYSAGTDKTTVVSSVVQGGVPFGDVTVRYTTSSVLTANVTLAPVAGNASVNISSPQNGVGYIFEQMESGNYLNVTQVEHTDSPNTVVAPDGAISQTVVRSFQARARDGSDKTWSTFSDILSFVVFAPTMPTTATTTVTAGATVLGTYAATAGSAPITYTLGGTNASLFTINSATGLVAFLAPAVVGAGSITVTATNSSGSAATTVNYTVNAAPEPTPGDGGHLLSGKTLRGTFIKGQTLKGKYL